MHKCLGLLNVDHCMAPFRKSICRVLTPRVQLYHWMDHTGMVYQNCPMITQPGVTGPLTPQRTNPWLDDTKYVLSSRLIPPESHPKAGKRSSMHTVMEPGFSFRGEEFLLTRNLKKNKKNIKLYSKNIIKL